MIVTRDDMIVLLFGITKYCENHWMFADLDDEEIKASYDSLYNFDDEETANGIIDFLTDWRDELEEIRWSVDVVLDYLHMSRRDPEAKVAFPRKADQPDTEIEYTGGGIWCGYCKLEDGWFGGEFNWWGGVWKTKEQAIEAFANEENGFVRYITDKAEQAEIWKRIYNAELSNPTYCIEDEINENLKTLDSDLESC